MSYDMDNQEQQLLEKINKCKKEIRKWEKQMERANVSSIGDYMNKIDLAEDILKYYESKYNSLKNAKKPSQVKIACYVLVTSKEKIKSVVGGENFLLFDADRYHDSQIDQWKPFKSNLTIKELLKPIEDRYAFTTTYINNENITDNDWIVIGEEIQNVVAIIDLFSLDDSNKLIAVRLDDTKAGVLLPLCRSLSASLVEIAEKLKGSFNVIKARTNKSFVCELYAADISSMESFQQHLLRIFKNKFPIKNQSTSYSDIRDINMEFQ